MPSEAVEALCRETWLAAKGGVCPVHGGDACLVRPAGLLAENERLRKLVADQAWFGGEPGEGDDDAE
jgi:hypothetical protein